MTKPARTCRGCGCTDDRACPGGCSWVLMDFAYHDGYALESRGNALAVAPKLHITPLPTGMCSACAEECEWDTIWMAMGRLKEIP